MDRTLWDSTLAVSLVSRVSFTLRKLSFRFFYFITHLAAFTD